MIDINQIALFVQIVRAGSFAEVARRRGIPANTISRRVAQLELQLGTRLLQRSTRKLAVTAAGRTLYDQSAGAVESLEQAGIALLDGRAAPSGLVRIAAPADFFDIFQIEWVREFLQMYPKVRVDFLLNDARVDLIAEGIDLAFRAGQLPDSSYVVRKIFETAGVMVASPELIKRVGHPASFVALHDMACVTSPATDETTVWQATGPNGVEEVSVRAAFRANTIVALKQACIAGVGVAMLPLELVQDELRAGHLVRVLPDYTRTLGGMYAVLPSRRHVPLAVSRFMDFAIDAMRARLAARTAPAAASPARV